MSQDWTTQSFTGPAPKPPPSVAGGQQDVPNPDWMGAPTGAPETPDQQARTGDPANPIEDAYDQVKQLAGAAGHLIKLPYDLITNPDVRAQWKQRLSTLKTGQGWSDLGNGVFNGVKQDLASHWTDPTGNFDLGWTLWHRPFSAALDASVLKDMLGAGVKGAARLAGGASFAKATAEELAKLGPLSTADKAYQFGQKLQDVTVDPMTWAAKGAAKAVPRVREAFGFGPETASMDQKFAEADSMARVEGMQKEDVLKKAAFGDEGVERILDARDRGAAEDFAALKPEEAAYEQAYKATQTNPRPVEQDLLDRGLITKEEKLDALAKQASLRTWGDVTPEHLAEATENISSGKWNPTYSYLATEKTHEYSWLENLSKDMTPGAGKGVSFLEDRSGHGNYIKDRRQADLLQIKNQTEFNARTNGMRSVLDDLDKKGLVKRVASERDIPAGYDIVPHEILQKYINAEHQMAMYTVAAQAKGLDFTAATRDAWEKMLPDLMRDTMGGRGDVLAIPKYAANWMRFRSKVPSALARSFDKLASYWKGAATVLRPQYWMNLAGGMGALSAFTGVGGRDALRYARNLDALPPELRAIMQTRISPQGSNVVARAITSGKQFDAMMHQHQRGFMLAHNIEGMRPELQAMQKRLADAGHSFFASADTLSDPDKFYQMVANGPANAQKALQEKTSVLGQIANQTPELMSKIREHDAAAMEMNAAGKAITGRGPNTLGQAKYLDLYEQERKLNQAVEGMKAEHYDSYQRLGMIQKQIPELDRVAQWAEQGGIQGVNQLTGAFSRLHPLEKQWAARFIPFYPFSKAMTQLVFHLPYMYSGRSFLWNRWSSMMDSLSGQEEHMPPWLQGSLMVGHTGDGSSVYVKPMWNPFRSENPTTLGGVPLPGILGDLPMRHPLLKVAHDLIGGVDSFTMKPWSTDETMVRKDTGEVFKMDPKTGNWQRALAQPPLMRRLWGLLPESQMIDQLFLPHVQTDKGWIGHPDPVLQGGEPIQVPFMQRLSKSLLPVSFQSEDQQASFERSQQQLYKQYVKEIRKAPPDQQQTMMTILDDALRARK